ncbi:MAG TPA: histidine phosphatase family protein [Actinomycetota bacterium]
MRRVLTLIRHGRVDFDARDAFRESPRGRQWDPPLGEEGRKQAGLLAARLEASPPFSAIWCSPFRRCVETIEPYATATGMEIRSDERFGEVFVGEWEGLPFEEIVASDEQLARMFREQEAMFGLAPGGESGAELRARVLPAVEELLETTEGDVAVVAHGGVINAYVASLLGLEQDMFFLPDNTSLNTVVVEEGAPRVRFLNDVRHITEPFVFVPSGTDKDEDEAG